MPRLKNDTGKRPEDWPPFWARIWLGALATNRIAHMIALEDGPGNIFDNFRTWLLLYPGLPDPNSRQVHWIKKGFHCPLCLSFWISIPISLFFIVPVRLGMARKILLYWLGLAGGSMVAHQIGHNSNDQ